MKGIILRFNVSKILFLMFFSFGAVGCVTYSNPQITIPIKQDDRVIVGKCVHFLGIPLDKTILACKYTEKPLNLLCKELELLE